MQRIHQIAGRKKLQIDYLIINIFDFIRENGQSIKTKKGIPVNLDFHDFDPLPAWSDRIKDYDLMIRVGGCKTPRCGQWLISTAWQFPKLFCMETVIAKTGRRAFTGILEKRLK